MGTAAYFAPNARRCCGCDRTFPAADLVEREVYSYSPDVYDRPDVCETRIVDGCPFCGCEQLQAASLCPRCLTVAPEQGGDFCAPCETIVEAAEHEALMLVAGARSEKELTDTLLGMQSELAESFYGAARSDGL